MFYPVCFVLGAGIQKNNIFDSDIETKISNVRLILANKENTEKETFSNVNGFYEFSDLQPGSYVVSIDSDWLPERTYATGQLNSKTHFNYFGWVSDISYKNMNRNINIPIAPKELEIKWDIKEEQLLYLKILIYCKRTH